MCGSSYSPTSATQYLTDAAKRTVTSIETRLAKLRGMDLSAVPYTRKLQVEDAIRHGDEALDAVRRFYTMDREVHSGAGY